MGKLNKGTRSIRGAFHYPGMFLATAITLVLLLGTTIPAQAQQWNWYYVRHTFRLSPLLPGITPVVFGGHYDHAYVQARGIPPNSQYDVDPSPQPNPLWGPYGNDRDRFLWVDNISTTGAWLPEALGWDGPLASPWMNSWNATASVHGSFANANSAITLIGHNPVWANLYSWGFSFANRITGWSRAYAFSATKIVAFGVRRGNIMWGIFIGSASGSAAARYDPIDFIITDASSGDTLQTGNLMTITVDGIKSNPDDTLDFWWEEDQVHIGATDLNFEINMNAAYVDTGWGQLDLEIENGVVTKSNGKGAFAAAWLPDVGQTTPLDFDLDTTITIAYNLPATITGHPTLDYQVHLGGSGMNHDRPPVAFPALTEWGVAVLVFLLLAAGMMVIIRRRRAMAQI